jgi:hypothetical protein
MDTRACITRQNQPTAVIDLAALSGVEQSMSVARQWPASACTVAILTQTDGVSPRRACLHISFGALTRVPTLWGARFWEENLPNSEDSVDWLITSPEPISSVEDALHLLRSRPDLVTDLGCC